MEALFTSLLGGEVLRARVIEIIAEASALAKSEKIDLHVMAFAFTDEEVADLLADAAARHTSITVRILADWSQRIHSRGQQVARLASLGLPNLHVRYKNDQPYLWDAAKARLKWSYRVSRGLLHHKTLSVLVNGHPRKLICGSFNWTATAARSYENLLILTADECGSRQLMSRIELEFEALWSDGSATLSAYEAHLHYRSILDEYQRDPTTLPSAITGFAQARGEELQTMDRECRPQDQENLQMDPRDAPTRLTDPRVEIAFNSRMPGEPTSQAGFANSNRLQRFVLCTPSGKARRVPLTITNLALDTIFSATPGDTIKMAMYGLSARVPEYGALLEAARRGVRILILLDRVVGLDVSSRLVTASRLEGLPIAVRTARNKMMHQKYIVIQASSTVLTGTANMSSDASARHSEHRIRIRGDAALALHFTQDFDTIWSRLEGRARERA